MKTKTHNPLISKLSFLARVEQVIFYFLILFLPTQLGKHFWPDFASVLGIRVDYLSPTVYITDILIFLLFSFWLLRSLVENLSKESKIKNQKSKIQFKSKKYSSVYVYVFTILFLIFNILIPDRILGGLYSLLKLLEMSFVAYYTAQFVGEKMQLGKTLLLFSASVIFESVLSIFQFLKQGSVGGLLYFLGERSFDGSTPGIANASLNGALTLRPYGTFSHPNVLAGYLVVVLSLALLLLQYRKADKESGIKNQESRFKKRFFPLIHNSSFMIQVAALLLGSIALFLSMSRVAIVLWAMVMVYYFLIQIRKRILIFPFVGLLVLFILSPLGSRFTNITARDEAVVQRSVLINSSLKMIESHPFIGIGLGNFIPTLAKIQRPLSLGLYLQPVHNIFLLIASETGLIGLGIFTWFLVRIYKRLLQNKSTVLLIILSTILILGLFDHYWLTLQQGQLLLALVIGFSLNDKIFL